MPRTQKQKKRAIRFCGDCGYALAPDGDGTCPMCPRLQQLEMDFTVPRPSDRGAHRAPVVGDAVAAALDDWPPTVAEYRAILADRRASTSAARSPGRVLERPELREIRAPAPPVVPTGHGVDALAARMPPPAGQVASSPPKVGVKRSKGKRGDHAARAVARSPAAEEHKRDPGLTSSAAPPSADIPMTHHSTDAPEDLDTPGAPAQSSSTRRHTPRPRIDPSPVQAESVRHVEALRRWIVTTGVVAASALVALVVATFLSST